MNAVKLGIRLTSIAVLVWTLQACCCGGTPLKSGPPGSISGQIDPAPGVAPGPLTVYAVTSVGMAAGHTDYYAIHLPAPATTYTLAVPPGYYSVVTRLDGISAGGAGYTHNVDCAKTQSCRRYGGNALATVGVDSMKTTSGIDLGDWGTPHIAEVLWQIDLYGSAPLNSIISPRPVSIPSRSLPPASADLSVRFTSSQMGLTLGLPATWRDVKDPNGNAHSDIYLSNENVASPLELDSAGVWLTIGIVIERFCPDPDWRFTRAWTTVTMQGGSNMFFFQDPIPRDGPQPFTGYSIQGNEFVLGNCIQFTMTGSTQKALDDSLAAFAAILQTADFGPICASCPSDLHPATSA